MDPDLESFLSRVTEVESVIKGLNSQDSEIVNQSLHRSDLLLDKECDKTENIVTRTGFNKSSINKSITDNPSTTAAPSTDQDGFMKVMEQDANERHARKQKAIKQADLLKSKGNEQFGLKCYEEAYGFYSEAIRVLKDNTVIYTNRAQCLIHLKRFEEALVDCDWALRVNESFAKAFIHRGRALTYLKRFDEALAAFESARKCGNVDAGTVDGYIVEMERCRLTCNQEKSVEMFLVADGGEKSGVLGILENLNKCTNNSESLLYYSGGLRALAEIMSGIENRTLFRVHKGFEMIEEHLVIGKCFGSSDDLKSEIEIDLVISVVELLKRVSLDCDENVRCVLELRKFWKTCIAIVRMQTVGNNELCASIHEAKMSILSLLVSITGTDYGIEKACSNLGISELIDCLVHKGSNSRGREEVVVITRSLEAVQNLALNTRFQEKLSNNKVTNLLRDLCEIIKVHSTNKYIQSLTYTIIYSLTSRANLRALIIDTDIIWTQSISTLKRAATIPDGSESIIQIVLSLLVNISSNKTGPITTYAQEIIETSLQFIDLQPDTVLKLIGNTLQSGPQNPVNFKHLDKGFTLKLIDFVKSGQFVDQGLKVLALCTTFNKSYCVTVLEADERVDFLYKFFENVSQCVENNESKVVNLKKLNESRINNAALCMSNCVVSSSCLGGLLLGSNVVMDLLYLARDGRKKDMQKNCGILIAKLCKANDKHLIQLRELHGVEILHSALKNCDL